MNRQSIEWSYPTQARIESLGLAKWICIAALLGFLSMIALGVSSYSRIGPIAIVLGLPQVLLLPLLIFSWVKIARFVNAAYVLDDNGARLPGAFDVCWSAISDCYVLPASVHGLRRLTLTRETKPPLALIFDPALIDEQEILFFANVRIGVSR